MRSLSVPNFGKYLKKVRNPFGDCRSFTWSLFVYGANFYMESQGECMNWKRFFAAMFALLAILSVGSTRLLAQTSTTGDITGIVTDQTGAVVPDAKVTLKDNNKGNTQDAVTNHEGMYRFYLLSPSSYTVSVTATGFNSVSRTAELGLGQVAPLNIHSAL